jgi:hypothetical protein
MEINRNRCQTGQNSGFSGRANSQPFLVNAYSTTAKIVDKLTEPVEELQMRERCKALPNHPVIGEGIFDECIMTERMSRLESLQTGHDPNQKDQYD